MLNPHSIWRQLAVSAMLATVLFRAASIDGQTSANSVFDVASVKANRSGDLAQRIQPSPGGRLTVTNVSLRGLVRFAYEMQDVQIAGGPSWFALDRFDIAGK